MKRKQKRMICGSERKKGRWYKIQKSPFRETITLYYKNVYLRRQNLSDIDIYHFPGYYSSNSIYYLGKDYVIINYYRSDTIPSWREQFFDDVYD